VNKTGLALPRGLHLMNEINHLAPRWDSFLPI
jgi:hypothetical protein